MQFVGWKVLGFHFQQIHALVAAVVETIVITMVVYAGYFSPTVTKI